MGISTFPAPSAGAVSKNYKEQIFNASGTWTYPSSSNFDGTVEVTCVGGGGAGGGIRAASGSLTGLGGGGGGGRVLLNQKISVLGLGNQTVTVGAGGVSNWASGFGSSSGRYSIFGSAVVANYYPDPAMRHGLYYNGSGGITTYPESRPVATVSDNGGYDRPNIIDSVTNTGGYGVKTGGLGNGTYYGVIRTNITTAYTGLFEVPASTAMTLMFFYTWAGATSGSTTPEIYWYDSNNVNISSVTTTAFTRPTSGTTFTQYTSGTITSPSNAAWARITWTGGGVGINGLTLAPNSASVTTPVSGNTSGYQWGGSPEGSVTIKNNASNLVNFVIAQGGGGGMGFSDYQNGSALGSFSGLYGWTSGGFALQPGQSAPSTTEFYFGGSGGGAGGNATEPIFNPMYTFATASNSQAHIADGQAAYNLISGGNASYMPTMTVALSSGYYGGGQGAYAYKYNLGSTSLNPFQMPSQPGNGINGYGAGGTAPWSAGPTSFNPATTFSKGWSKGFGNKVYIQSGSGGSKFETNGNNTGAGGNGAQLNASSGTQEGRNGSSGLVIVRWYE